MNFEIVLEETTTEVLVLYGSRYYTRHNGLWFYEGLKQADAVVSINLERLYRESKNTSK